MGGFWAKNRPDFSPSQKGEFHKLAEAKVFLSDCLACDSCVTAEEGVQVSQQNAKDFFRVLNLNKVRGPVLPGTLACRGRGSKWDADASPGTACRLVLALGHVP